MRNLERPLRQIADEISVEQDPRKLMQLVDELMALLEKHEEWNENTQEGTVAKW